VTDQAPTSQQFQGAHVKARTTKNPGCKVHLEVEVDPEAVQAGYVKALHHVKKEVSIPGFRKGKVPDDVVIKNFAREIDREWRDLTARTAFHEALELIKCKPLSQNAVNKVVTKKISKEGAEIHFDYESEPEIPSLDYSSMKCRLEAPKQVTEADIEFELKRQRVRHATYEDVTDRPVASGDYITLDLDVTDNPAHNVFSGRLFCVDKDEMPKWAYELILGCAVNESREGKAKAESFMKGQKEGENSEEGENSPEVTCRITPTAIKKANLPPLDDEFAKKYGVANLDELKNRIREVLERDAKASVQEAARSLLAHELVERYPIDLPESLLNREAQMRFNHAKEWHTQKEGALPQGGELENRIRWATYEIARQFLTTMYLMNQIAEKQKFNVSNEEFVQEVTFETTQVPPEQRVVFAKMDPEEARNRLFMRIVMRKALDWILQEVDKS